MTDIRLRNGIIIFLSGIVLMLLLVLCYSSCTKQPSPALIGERKHSTSKKETIVNALPPQKIDTVEKVKIMWKTQYRDKYIQDTLGYIAVSDTIKGIGGTEFIVEYDTHVRTFGVPYLQERADTTRTITDSVIIERTMQTESSTFWKDAGNFALGVAGGLLLSIGIK